MREAGGGGGGGSCVARAWGPRFRAAEDGVEQVFEA